MTTGTQTAVAPPTTAVYLDCNATTPVEPQVLEEVVRYLVDEYGNAGSRTHGFGQRAKERVQLARRQIAAVVRADSDEVIFTSGATESSNIAILGMAAHGEATRRQHVVSTLIEHKAVLEPLDALRGAGFEVDLVPPTSGGWMDPDRLRAAIRPDTLLVSLMHVNNETGVVQPLTDVVNVLADHDAYLHVDAAQGFGKELAGLQDRRIDLISVSGHKIYAPKGVGALIARRRDYVRPPLRPLQYGGGQERGLRPGTLPVPLIAGLGTAAELALRNHRERAAACGRYREQVLNAFADFPYEANGDQARAMPHVLNISLLGLDSEAVMLALKDVLAISNGSACTSHSYEPSHVLAAMGLPDERIRGALRLSWSHLTPDAPWDEVVARIRSLT